MPQVASDPVVQRPLRPESLSGRTGASPAESSGAFKGLLDTPPAERPARPERASRNRGAESTERSRPADDRPEPRRDAGARKSDTPNPTKPAETDITRQVKNGQSADSTEPAATPAEAASPTQPAGETAPVLTVEFAALAETAIDCTAAEPAEADATKNAKTKPADTAEADADVQVDVPVAANTTTPIAAAIAVVAPVPVPVEATATPNADATTVGAIEVQVASAAAPKAAIQAPAETADTPASVDAAPAEPHATPATKAPIDSAAPADDAPETPAPKATEHDEAIDTKLAVPAERKSEPGAPKSEHPAQGTRAADPQTPQAAAPPADAAEPKAHRPQPQAAEHTAATARAAVADRPELPANTAAPAQANAGLPPPPFSLATHVTLPTLSPLTALRVDAAADNAIPVAGLVVEIVARSQDGNRRFEIRLDPPELGRIDVRLDVDQGGKVTSRLVVERAETLDLLRRDAPQLERALQHAGLNTEGGLEFSLRDQNFANRDQTPRENIAARLIVPDDETVAAEAARRGYGRMIGLGGGVDIRV